MNVHLKQQHKLLTHHMVVWLQSTQFYLGTCSSQSGTDYGKTRSDGTLFCLTPKSNNETRRSMNLCKWSSVGIDQMLLSKVSKKVKQFRGQLPDVQHSPSFMIVSLKGID